MKKINIKLLFTVIVINIMLLIIFIFLGAMHMDIDNIIVLLYIISPSYLSLEIINDFIDGIPLLCSFLIISILFNYYYYGFVYKMYLKLKEFYKKQN